MSDIKRLKKEAKDFTLLYAEDNESLRHQAGTLLKKFFPIVYLAQDGEDALSQFKKHRPSIVITDIKMPKRDGMLLAKDIKSLCSETIIIVMSAFDDKEYLFEGIKLGIFRFIKKPVSAVELTEVLLEAVELLHKKENNKIFFAHLNDVFNYQSALVLMMEKERMILASQRFLDFFGVDSIEEFEEKRGDIGTCFLKHSGFLYNQENKNWFDVASRHQDKLFHIKMTDSKHEMSHFIFKFHSVPEKPDFSILSFDDITELDLLNLFDDKKNHEDKVLSNQKAIFDLLDVIERNHAKVKLHNFYRGLSIANDAIVSDTKNQRLHVKTNYLQQKAIQIEKRSIITSEALPNDLMCEEMIKNNFDEQSVIFKLLHFIPKSPTQRKSIRLEPNDDTHITLFFNEHKFFGDVKIIDLSINAVKVSMNALPAGLDEDEMIRLDMILTMDKRQVIINSPAHLLKKTESNRLFNLVFILDLPSGMKHSLTEYISKRQMQLIREFKGL